MQSCLKKRMARFALPIRCLKFSLLKMVQSIFLVNSVDHPELLWQVTCRQTVKYKCEKFMYDAFKEKVMV